MKYHINPETGNPGRCSAKAKCRFGDSDHYDSADEARIAYENSMKLESNNSGTLESYEKTFDAYVAGSPQTVGGGMKQFIDESFKDLPRGSKIIELGSGFGRDARYLEDAGFNVIATDAPDVFVEELKRRGLEAKKLNALTDGIPRTDAVFANAVFLHFSRDEFARVTNKIYRSLNGLGHLAFTVKEGEGEGWSTEKIGEPRYFTYWKKEDLETILSSTGFEDINITSDQAGPVTWLQVHARKPRNTNKAPNVSQITDKE